MAADEAALHRLAKVPDWQDVEREHNRYRPFSIVPRVVVGTGSLEALKLRSAFYQAIAQGDPAANQAAEAAMASPDVQRRAVGSMLWAFRFDPQRILPVAAFLEDTNLCAAAYEAMSQTPIAPRPCRVPLRWVASSALEELTNFRPSSAEVFRRWWADNQNYETRLWYWARRWASGDPVADLPRVLQGNPGGRGLDMILLANDMEVRQQEAGATAMRHLAAQIVSPAKVAEVVRGDPARERCFHELLLGGTSVIGQTSGTNMDFFVRLAPVARFLYAGREREIFEEFRGRQGNHLDLVARLLAELAPGLEPRLRRELLLEIVNQLPADHEYRAYGAVRTLSREPGWDEAKYRALATYFSRQGERPYGAQAGVIADAGQEGKPALAFILGLWQTFSPRVFVSSFGAQGGGAQGAVISAFLDAFNHIRGQRCFTEAEVALLQSGGKITTEGARQQAAAGERARAAWPEIQRRAALLEREPFPLKIGLTGRYLVDQQGFPFLIVGDTAWSIIVDLNEADLKRYLDDRRAKGFNSLLVNLIEHKFAASPPATRSGLKPFAAAKSMGLFAHPNDAYFAWAEALVREAHARGLLVWLTPAYLGYGGGDEGWFAEIKAGGPEALRVYGRYVGERFRKYPNIIWVMGGDFTPPKGDEWTVEELARGIREYDPAHLITGHFAPGTSAAAAFPQAAWLGVNSAYSYDTNLYRPLQTEYRRSPTRPFVLLESTYENEHNSAPWQIRRQAYWAMLCGAAGQFFGNNPIWHFDAPGLFPASTDWRIALNSEGSRDMARLEALFLRLPWFELQPDLTQKIVTEGVGEGTARILTAMTADGKLAVSYVPVVAAAPRIFTVDLAYFPGPVVAEWYNPANGLSRREPWNPRETFANEGSHSFTTPPEDGPPKGWLLMLEVQP